MSPGPHYYDVTWPMSRPLGLSIISCPPWSLVSSVSSLPRMISGISCCIIWLRLRVSESVYGVDGLRSAALLPTLVRLGRAGPASEYSQSVVVVCCVLPQLRLLRLLWLRCWTRLRPGPQWLHAGCESHTEARKISVTAGPGPGPHCTVHHSWPGAVVIIVTQGCDIWCIMPPVVTGDNAMWD